MSTERKITCAVCRRARSADKMEESRARCADRAACVKVIGTATFWKPTAAQAQAVRMGSGRFIDLGA